MLGDQTKQKKSDISSCFNKIRGPSPRGATPKCNFTPPETIRIHSVLSTLKPSDGLTYYLNITKKTQLKGKTGLGLLLTKASEKKYKSLIKLMFIQQLIYFF